MDQLPASILIHIFSFLDTDSLGRASQVCKTFHTAAHDPLPRRNLSFYGKTATALKCLLRYFSSSTTRKIEIIPFPDSITKKTQILTVKSAEMIVKFCPNLVSFKINGPMQILPEALEKLTHLPYLKVVDLSFTDIADQAVHVFLQTLRLEKLYINCCRKLNAHCFDLGPISAFSSRIKLIQAIDTSIEVCYVRDDLKPVFTKHFGKSGDPDLSLEWVSKKTLRPKQMRDNHPRRFYRRGRLPEFLRF